MNYDNIQTCNICYDSNTQFKKGDNCIHSICNEYYEKICQKCNNKCPMCRNVLNKELENVQKPDNTCYQCGDEIFEQDYEYIIDDDIHICVYCYNDYMPFIVRIVINNVLIFNYVVMV